MTSYALPGVREALLGLRGQWVPQHVALARVARFQCGTFGQVAVIDAVLQLWQQQQQERELSGERLSSLVMVSARGVARELYAQPSDSNRCQVRRILVELVGRGVLVETDLRGPRGVKYFDLAPLLRAVSEQLPEPHRRPTGSMSGPVDGRSGHRTDDPTGSMSHRIDDRSPVRTTDRSPVRMAESSGVRIDERSGALIERELCSHGAEQSSHEQEAAVPAAAVGDASAEPAAGRDPPRLDDARRRKSARSASPAWRTALEQLGLEPSGADAADPPPPPPDVTPHPDDDDLRRLQRESRERLRAGPGPANAGVLAAAAEASGGTRVAASG